MKSKMKRRMLAIVLCMVIVLSNSSFIFASSESGTPAVEAASTEGTTSQTETDTQGTETTPQTLAVSESIPAPTDEPAAPTSVEATPTPTDTPEATTTPEPTGTPTPEATPTPTDTQETTTTPEPTDAPEITTTPEPTDTPEATTTPEPTDTQEATPTPTQGPENGTSDTAQPTATPTPTEAPVKSNEAVELKQEFKDSDGNVTSTVKAQIPEGTFAADASEITMEVQTPDTASAEHVKEMMEELLPENHMLGDYIFYDIQFKVNGTVTEPQKPITITFEGEELSVKDVKRANVFWLDPEDPQVDGDKDQLVEITQKSEMIENLQNSGQSTENIDDYDLSEITLKEDGISDKIQMEGRTSTIYGCYVVYEPVQVLTYDDEQVTVTVSAAEEGIIPANAELKVVPITAEDKNTEDQYKEVEQKLQEKAEEDAYDIAGFLAYDITFVDEDGNETEPGGEVKVSIDYKEAAIPETVSEEDAANAEVTVLHLEEDEKGEVKEVVDMAQDEKVDVLATTEENKVEKAEVRTESFSVYSIVWVGDKRRLEIDVEYYYYNNGNYLRFYPSNEETIRLGDGGRVDLEASTNENKILAQHTVGNITYKYAGARVGDPETGEWMEYIDDQYDNRNWQAYYGIEYSLRNGNTWKPFDGDDSVCLIYSNSDDIPTIRTIDSKSKGVTIKMFNYGASTPSANWGSYGNGTIKKNLVEKELSSQRVWNGSEWVQEYLPDATDDSYDSALKSSFSTGVQSNRTNYLGEANHLFSESIYESEGYFYYSSFDNYAYLSEQEDENGLLNYTVYDAKGTPSNNDAYYYQRGNFMPFNEIMAGYYSDNTVQYDEDGTELENGANGEGDVLYHTVGENDYYFGMAIEASFYQPVDGKVKNEDMIFEFNGDDDMWVFIDGVLVLDIGGIHDAHSGSINFATGEVEWTDCKTGGTPTTYRSTIKEMFSGTSKENTTEWDNNTFADYSAHDISIFYMERGASASNCKIKFNLQTIPDGQIQVEKHLNKETDPVKYGDVKFGFELYVENAGEDGANTGDYEKMTNEKLAEYDYQATIVGKQGENPLTTNEEGRFYLKPEEIAYFRNIPENLNYYVKEVDIKSEEYDKIEINNTPIVGEKYEGEDGNEYMGYQCGKNTVKSRPVVYFTNSCSAANMRTLRIDKEMVAGQESSASFKILVKLENENGKLEPFVGKYRIFKDSQSETTPGEYSNTTDGYIELQADEYACIYNILSDTDFEVTENPPEDIYNNPQYQVQVNDEGLQEGNSGTIQLNHHAQVIITNSYKASIQVSKVWSDLNDNVRHNSIYVGLYEIANNNITPVTDQWKELSADNWATSFVGMEADKTYTVRELRRTSGTEQAEFNIKGQGYIGVLEGSSIVNGELKYTVDYSKDNIKPSDADNLITITNTQAWQIVKRSTSEPHPELEGAEFQLIKLDENGDPTSTEYTGVSDDKGIIQWNNMTTPLENGTYSLKETKAPAGYSCGGDWTIDIENGLPKNIVGTLGTGNSEDLIEETDFRCYLKDGVITVYYDNTPLYNLPSAGSSGIFGYTMGGTLLLMAGTLILYKMKRKEVQES